MKQQHIHQELMIFTTTSLFNNFLCQINNKDKKENISLAEKLEQSCWDGLLNEMFPEIIVSSPMAGHQMAIRGIYPSQTCLIIELANTPFQINDALSIDPYLFLSELNSN